MRRHTASKALEIDNHGDKLLNPAHSLQQAQSTPAIWIENALWSLSTFVVLSSSFRIDRVSGGSDAEGARLGGIRLRTHATPSG